MEAKIEEHVHLIVQSRMARRWKLQINKISDSIMFMRSQKIDHLTPTNSIHSEFIILAPKHRASEAIDKVWPSDGLADLH